MFFSVRVFSPALNSLWDTPFSQKQKKGGDGPSIGHKAGINWLISETNSTVTSNSSIIVYSWVGSRSVLWANS